MCTWARVMVVCARTRLFVCIRVCVRVLQPVACRRRCHSARLFCRLSPRSSLFFFLFSAARKHRKSGGAENEDSSECEERRIVVEIKNVELLNCGN